MDGLMLDTEPLYREAWQQAAQHCGYCLPHDLYSHLIGRTKLEGELFLQQHFGAAFPLEDFRIVCEKFEAITLDRNPVPKKPGLETLLQLLDNLRTPKAVATSSRCETALRHLHAAKLLHRFDAIVAGDEVACGKPAPDLFLLAASKLKREPANCLVLEDSAAGVAAAHAAGMPVYVVPDLIPPSPETRRLATHVFPSLDHVARHLSQIIEPVRNPGGGEQHIEEPGAAVAGLAPCPISGVQPESSEHTDRSHEPVIERRESHERQPAAGHPGNQHD
jgi:HAD superfamily hydrolase (TIGR01509 family)